MSWVSERDFQSRLGAIQNDYKLKKIRLNERALEMEFFEEAKQLFINREKALQYIIILSDDNTKALREYLENVINRALDMVFGKNTYKFELVSDLKKQAISLNLIEYSKATESWQSLSISYRTGEGMGQIIAFLFTVILVEMTKHRMIFTVDEVLGGLHEDAIKFIELCLTEFSKHGAQFAMIEYTMKEFGTVVNLKRNSVDDSTNTQNVKDYGLYEAEKEKE